MDRGNWSPANFVRRTYWLVAGRRASKKEVEFHVNNSNPESFVNGFGNDPLWKQQKDHIDKLETDNNQMDATIARKSGRIKTLNKQLEALTGKQQSKEEEDVITQDEYNALVNELETVQQDARGQLARAKESLAACQARKDSAQYRTWSGWQLLALAIKKLIGKR